MEREHRHVADQLELELPVDVAPYVGHHEERDVVRLGKLEQAGNLLLLPHGQGAVDFVDVVGRCKGLDGRAVALEVGQRLLQGKVVVEESHELVAVTGIGTQLVEQLRTHGTGPYNNYPLEVVALAAEVFEQLARTYPPDGQQYREEQVELQQHQRADVVDLQEEYQQQKCRQMAQHRLRHFNQYSVYMEDTQLVHLAEEEENREIRKIEQEPDNLLGKAPLRSPHPTGTRRHRRCSNKRNLR